MKTIPISGTDLLALVDDADFETYSKWKWKISARGYVCRTKKQANKTPKCTTVYLHKEILGIGTGVIGDHRDRNPLNCQRDNLRVASKSKNAWNAKITKNKRHSRFKGVTFLNNVKLWYVKGVSGGFLHEEDAAKAYDKMIVGKRGEFAVTNKQLGLL